MLKIMGVNLKIASPIIFSEVDNQPSKAAGLNPGSVVVIGSNESRDRGRSLAEMQGPPLSEHYRLSEHHSFFSYTVICSLWSEAKYKVVNSYEWNWAKIKAFFKYHTDWRQNWREQDRTEHYWSLSWPPPVAVSILKNNINFYIDNREDNVYFEDSFSIQRTFRQYFF